MTPSKPENNYSKKIIMPETEKAPVNLPTPEQKKSFTKKQKIVALLTGVALMLSAIGFGANSCSKQRPNSSTSESSEPSDDSDSAETSYSASSELEPTMTEEEQKFIAEFGGRFADPVSTYYAETAYKEANDGLGAMISEDFIYDMSNKSNNYKDSELKFKTEKLLLPLTAEMNQETSIKIFNEGTAANLTRYMNLLARNNTPNTLAIVDMDFTKYCSDISAEGKANDFYQDDKNIKRLMDTLKYVVQKYGSAANYSMQPATNDATDLESTRFDKNVPTLVSKFVYMGKELTMLVDEKVQLVINIDLYDKDVVTHTQQVIEDIKLSAIQQPVGELKGAQYSLISIGQN